MNYTYTQKIYHLQFACINFLSNNFGGQESGSNSEIQSFCQKHGATFPVLGKIECESDNTHPLYKYLKETIPEPSGSTSLKWNFAKFICDANGIPIKRFGPRSSPLSFENYIMELIL